MRAWTIGVITVALGTSLLSIEAAEARRDRHHHRDWHDRWENRRDARRAGVITGIVVGGIANASAESQANRRYEECLYATGYDYECERLRYYDERQARRAGRRAGVVAGSIAYGVVRD